MYGDYRLEDWLANQWQWSKETFGDGPRTLGIIRHIRKELEEIEQKPNDLMEWIDVVILALDGFWRHGGKIDEVMALLEKKQQINFSRKYLKTSEDEPSQHIKE